MQDFRKLMVWRMAHDLAVLTIEHTAKVPRGHGELVAQVRRATASVGANIAEGAQRPTSAQFAHFLGIALASLAESHNHVLLLRDARIMRRALVEDLVAHIDRLRPMLLNLQARVREPQTDPAPRARRRTPPEPSTPDPAP